MGNWESWRNWRSKRKKKKKKKKKKKTGRFGRFSGPKGPKWNIHFWYLTQKERCTGQAECTQVTLFPYEYWVFEEKTRFGPVSGLPGPKRVSRNCRKWPKATGRNCVAGPFMHES